LLLPMIISTLSPGGTGCGAGAGLVGTGRGAAFDRVGEQTRAAGDRAEGG
jgi:hypothetical protein